MEHDEVNGRRAHSWKAFWTGDVGSFGEEIEVSLSLSKLSRGLVVVRGITMWIIWVKKNDLTYNNNRWDGKKLRITIDLAKPS